MRLVFKLDFYSHFSVIIQNNFHNVIRPLANSSLLISAVKQNVLSVISYVLHCNIKCEWGFSGLPAHVCMLEHLNSLDQVNEGQGSVCRNMKPKVIQHISCYVSRC